MPAYKRILLKLSGEALMGDDAYGINRATIVRMVRELKEITDLGVELAVVIGGGNIFRGVAGGSVGMDRATADYMGMLATVMNSLALADSMRQAGMTARVMSASEWRMSPARGCSYSGAVFTPMIFCNSSSNWFRVIRWLRPRLITSPAAPVASAASRLASTTLAT